MTWDEFALQVRLTASALYQSGVRRGDRVGILSENRPEWAFADLGILSLGAATVPIYPTSSVKECHYILEHAEVSTLFVSTKEQLEKAESLLGGGRLKTVVIFDLRENPKSGISSMDVWLEMGRRCELNNPDLYDQMQRGVSKEDIASIIYTSGTTGPPKGVMLTHGNFLSNCEAASEVLPLKGGERSLSFLPLSHVFERMAGYYFMILKGASIAYAENMQTVPEDLLLARPEVAAGVPRFFEKLHARILETVQLSSPLKQAIFQWAFAVGRKVAQRRLAHKGLSLPLQLQQGLAHFLVFEKLKKKLGGQIRFFISGGAPLGKEIAEFFFAAGILILEGYGLTETSPVITVNRPNQFKFGTVGLLLPGVEVRIAEDGEILTRGPHVMKGYFRSEEATLQAIREGWFYTGDIGEIDSEGFLKITGRKKDLIITAGGKNISPQNIESEILKDPLFAQVVVLGDRKPCLVALVVPNRIELERWVKKRGILTGSWEDALRSEAVHQLVSEHLHEKTKDFASYEQIKSFHLLPRELTQDAGELTPTLKVKRRVMMERYGSLIEDLYRKGEAFEKAAAH